MSHDKSTLILKKLGIDTYKESIIFLREDCHMCLSEGFEAKTCVQVKFHDKIIIATINIIKSNLLKIGEAALSEYALKMLGAKEGDKIIVSHARPVKSLSFVRSKIYGNILAAEEIKEVIHDITAGYYSDIQIAAFLTACTGQNMNQEEIFNLTKSMIDAGEKINWSNDLIVDKHCIGGLPGNRTTPIIVSIVAAFGLIIPKTSSRAITSPAGTADVMEVLTQVEFDVEKMKKIVAQENGCLAWGGSVSLSPADDILIRIEKALDLDSEAQLVASILSKKIAAGANHILIDIPIGETAKIRSKEAALILQNHLEKIGEKLDVKIKTIFTDGSQPVGNGIGPALEARDLIAVLKNDANAPQDLKKRAIMLAGEIIEFSPKIKKGEGKILAAEILNSGKAWDKFQAICKAQGGLKKIPQALKIHQYLSTKNGVISAMHNRRIALIAKLAGAPLDKTSGIDLHVKINDEVKKGQVLFSIHTSSEEVLEYVLDYLHEGNDIITIS